jgi:hypothetical protein
LVSPRASDRGVFPLRMHSMKCSHSTRRGSTLAMRGDQVSPERAIDLDRLNARSALLRCLP